MDNHEISAPPVAATANSSIVGPSLSLEDNEKGEIEAPPAKINLLGHQETSGALVPELTEPKSVENNPNEAAALKAWQPKILLALVAIAVMAGIGIGSYLLIVRQKPAKVVSQTTLKPTPAPAPPPITPVTPPVAPTPPPAPVPQTVTAPAVTPTTDHPQAVTVQSKSGLWLRSTPDSSSRSNIIGWMPNGAVVSVDQIGNFWWHGSYKGTAGYFASNYTQ